MPPRIIIRGPVVGAQGFAGVAFNFKHGEVYGVSGDLNGYTAYVVPEFFKTTDAAHDREPVGTGDQVQEPRVRRAG